MAFRQPIGGILMRKTWKIGDRVVELLEEEDAEEIEDLLKSVWPYAEDYPDEWRKRRALSADEVREEMRSGYFYFGIREEGRVVALYKAKIYDDICLGEHLSVHPDFRRRGLSRTLYAHIITFAKEMGCRRVHVNILPHQEASVRLVTRYGFKKIKEYEQIPGMLVHLYEKIVAEEDES